MFHDEFDKPNNDGNLSPDQRLKELVDRAANLDIKHELKPGMPVSWKIGLSLMRTTGPFLFRRYLEKPIPFVDDPGSLFFCEQADAVVADLMSLDDGADMSLVEWAVPSRRLQPFFDQKMRF